MTRPSDASIARAFWRWCELSDPESLVEPFAEFASATKDLIIERAQEFDAESPAGTDVIADELDSGYPATVQNDSFESCHGWTTATPVARGEEGKTSPLIDFADYHAKVCGIPEPAYDHCPKCTAHMPPGATCGGPNCPLRK